MSGHQLKPMINPIPRKLLSLPFPEHITDTSRIAEEIPGTKREGQTGHYRSIIFPDPSVLHVSPKPKTLFEMFSQAAAEVPDDPAMGCIPVLSKHGERPILYADEIKYYTYSEVDQARREIGSFLVHLYRTGMLGNPKKIERIDATGPAETGWGVGMWSGNRPEWQMTDLATQAYSFVSVALYDTFDAAGAEYVINHAGLTVIFVSRAHLTTLIKLLPKIPTVRAVICYDNVDGRYRNAMRAHARAHNVWAGDWRNARKQGREYLIDPIQPTQDSIVTLSYTSGTTGPPKGAVLTQRAFISATIANTYGGKASNQMERGSTIAQHLPLSHIFARFLDLATFYRRGCTVYTTGDPLRLLQDIQLVQPHTLSTVPRVLNRVYAALMTAINGPGEGPALMRKTIEKKIKRFRETGEYEHTPEEKQIFSRFAPLFGGRLIYISSGSAPISPLVYETFKVIFGIETAEGYGMTETVGTGTRNWSFDPKSTGTIGAPVIVNIAKLVDVPEMQYYVTDKPNARGELCLKGDNIFSGYYKNEKATKEALDSEGWLYTGDICSVDEGGRFRIIDRKRNIIKLSQGEFVALETVQGVYADSPLFTSLYLHGSSFKDYLVALCVLNPVDILKLARGKIPEIKDAESLVKIVEKNGRPARELKQLCINMLQALGREKGLKGYEMIKGIYLLNEEFSGDCLTPTMKLKRNVVADVYKKQLEQAYKESEETQEPKRSSKRGSKL